MGEQVGLEAGGDERFAVFGGEDDADQIVREGMAHFFPPFGALGTLTPIESHRLRRGLKSFGSPRLRICATGRWP